MAKSRRPWIVSLTLHLLILVALCIFFAPQQYTEAKKSSSASPIKVHAVSKQQVDNQLQAIAAVKAQKLAAIKKQQRLKRQRQLAKQRAKARAIKLAAQKRQARILAQRKAAQAKKLRQQRLAKQKAIAKQKALVQQKLLAKQQAIAKQKAIAQQKALAKKKALAKQQALALQQKQQELLQKLNSQQMNSDATQVNQVVTARNNAIIDKYRAQILAKMQLNWHIPKGSNPSLESTFLVRLAPGGVVMDVQLVKGSGLPALDLATKAAIIKSSPLPVPKDPSLFDNFRSLRLTATPKGFVQSRG